MQEVKDISKIFMAVMLKNSCAIICFTVLAILFKKWWIVLFAALFITSIETHKDEDE